MGVKTFLFLCLAFATKFMLVQAEIDKECVYEGQRFKADRWGQLPLETHRNCETEIECKEKCDSKSTCVIWQWQPTRKICWIMNVEPYRDGNSDFGINHCDKGKPTENAPQCKVTKGDRNNVWQDYKDMTREECITKCDSDCLIWQHIKNRKLCRIHKLEVDLSKKSQVGIHYCGSSEVTSTNSTEPSSSCNGLNRVRPGRPQRPGPQLKPSYLLEEYIKHNHEFECPNKHFVHKHLCSGYTICNPAQKTATRMRMYPNSKFKKNTIFYKYKIAAFNVWEKVIFEQSGNIVAGCLAQVQNPTMMECGDYVFPNPAQPTDDDCYDIVPARCTPWLRIVHNAQDGHLENWFWQRGKYNLL